MYKDLLLHSLLTRGRFLWQPRRIRRADMAAETSPKNLVSRCAGLGCTVRFRASGLR